MLNGIKLSTQSDTTAMLDTGTTLRYFFQPNPWKHIGIKRGSSMQHSNIFKTDGQHWLFE